MNSSGKIELDDIHLENMPLGKGEFRFDNQKNTMKSCGLIDYDLFRVDAGFVNDTWFLTITGTVPTISMMVDLRPLIYVRQPEYWGIEVVGCFPPIVLPAVGHFVKTIEVTGSMGTKGLEIIGASKSDTWDKP